MGRGKDRGNSKRGKGGKGIYTAPKWKNGGTMAGAGSEDAPLTAGKVGLDVHAVAESTRITLDRQLHAFRDDESLKTLSFPPALDNTSRKFIHAMAKKMGLKSKSQGKGEARFITVTRIEGKGRDRADLPPILRLGQARDTALDTYFSYRPPAAVEVDGVMSAAAGGGMHAAAELATQKKHKAGLLDKQARAMLSAGASAQELAHRANTYAAAQSKRLKAPGYQRMSTFRQGLPAWSHREAIVGMVRDHQACLVSGETGCGKSTQVPQFLLDDPAMGPGCKIVCTQPRRISAIAVAERIAEERGENIGGKVGYTIRLESSMSKDTQLIMMTPGILLKKLDRDPMLKEYTHVLIDEVHERDRNSEFLLIVLRGLLTKRPDLRLVLMSATLQQGKYSGYFGGCPITTIGARTFPVQAFFLEDVLVQTKYLGEMGAETGGGGVGGLLGGSGLAALEEEGEGAYDCALCGKAGFRSAEELGTHAAMCFGTAGLDPALEGFSKEGLQILLSGDGSTGAAAGGAGELDEEIPSPLRGPPSSAKGFDRSGSAAGAGWQGSASAGAGAGTEVNNGGVSSLENGGGGHAGGGVQGGNGMDTSDFDVDSIGDPEPQAAEQDDDDDDDFVGREDNMGGGGLHDAMALSQRWDGKGAFRAEKASSKSGRAEELLTKYQFAFDDESVDYELVECLLRYICRSAYEEGAVLVFLPGWDDISRLGDFLRQSSHFSDERKFQILPLHSGVPTSAQRQVFASPPAGCRKIVLSTNIAETSITIDDVAFVIDSGRAKESNYDPHLKIKTLVPQWVSKASARQRRGRAGRTKAGVCFHLFSALRHESLRDYQESELLRTPLEEVVLQAKMLGLANGKPGEADSAAGFLAQAIDSPPELSVKNAVQLLQSLGALDDQEELTDLGSRLAGISIDPRVGKMVLWSYLLGCAGPALTAACAMTYKDPFVLPMNASQRNDAKTAKINLAQGSESDLIALLRALEGHAQAKAQGGMGAAMALARRGHLSANTLGMIWDICGQVERELKGLGLPAAYDWSNSCNSHCRDVSLLSSVLCAGLYPNVAMRRPGGTNFKTLGGHTARLHMSSINAARSQRLAQPNTGSQTEFIAFGEMTRTASNFVMSNTTPVSPLALMLLCGNLRVEELPPGDDEDEDEDYELCDEQELAGMGGHGGRQPELLLELDDWVKFRLRAEQGRLLLILRNRLHTAFAQHMQANGRPVTGPAAEVVTIVNALLHEPSVADGAAAAAAASSSYAAEPRDCPCRP